MKKLITVALVFVLALAAVQLVACGEKKPDFKALVAEMHYETPFWIDIGDDNSYCKIDTNPYDIDDYSNSEAKADIEVMNSLLGLPDYLMDDMNNTSYSQGKQTETFGDIIVTYSYHPDYGLEVTYKLVID